MELRKAAAVISATEAEMRGRMNSSDEAITTTIFMFCI
jgi:hypothetical protein